ncbi:MAG: ABC transporter substrate-binding protein [Alphaproteobacteria bacterium]|nr:ABC transporter substrate-binding protein [Alphaproteobacteria bacterium]
MKITRRQFGALAGAAVLLRNLPAEAASDVFVPGWNLPANVDPHQVMDVPAQNVAFNLYDNLYRYEDNPPQMVPWLAESHTVSDDGLTWVFKLKPGSKFQDGSDLAASDVVYSMQRLLKLHKAPAAAFLSILKPEDVTAPDTLTVKMVLSKAYAPFLAAIPLLMVVNEKLVKAHEKDGDWGATWVASNGAGSGAYKLIAETYTPLEKVDLERFDGHFAGWGHNKNPVRRVEIRPTQVTSTRVLGVLNGSLDMTDSYLPADQIDNINNSGHAHVIKNQQMRIFTIRMHNKRPPFDNINARKCFAHAFNYAGFIEEILKGNATRDPAPLPNNLWGFPNDVKGYEYDLDKAKDYLKKAIADGAPMKRAIELHGQQDLDQAVQAGQVFQADLQSLGLNVKLVGDTFANMTSNSAKVETTPDMWIHWVSTYFVDPENWVGQMYDSQFHGTWKASCWYENAKVDELLRKARGLTDQTQRAPLYEDAIRQIVADSPDIWIYNTIELAGLANRVKNLKYCPVGSGCEVRWMSLEA